MNPPRQPNTPTDEQIERYQRRLNELIVIGTPRAQAETLALTYALREEKDEKNA